MQTLSSARLTSKPPLESPSQRACRILRHRGPFPSVENPSHDNSDPRTVELVTRFLASAGVPLETSEDPTFLELIKHLNKECVVPATNVMSAFLEKCTTNPKPLVNYQKTVGPLTVTLDTQRQEDQSYLVFSIHYFEDLYERKNIVYLRKLHLGEINPDTLLVAIRRAVNYYTYQSVKFSNIVLPNELMYNEIRLNSVVKQSFICFYYYMSQFANEILAIPELKVAIEGLRRFVKFLKKDMDTYGNFRIMRMTKKKEELNVPRLDEEGVWESTAMFLTKCLVLHDTFTEYCHRFSIPIYISNTTFIHLVYFQRILQQCIKHSRNLSQPDNSISQIIPAIQELRNHIVAVKIMPIFQNRVLDSMDRCFKNIILGSNRVIYELATFLDPRYGHRDLEKSVEMEKKVILHFIHADSGKSFFSDISLMNREERITTIKQELLSYRKVVHVHRPEENESPFIWWGRRQTDMEFLAVISREYLATPATCISARAYFSDSGKFHHLCETYSYTELENYLFAAGLQQKYTGRGWTNESISQKMQETLRNMENIIEEYGKYNKPIYVVEKVERAPPLWKRPLPPPISIRERIPEKSYCQICNHLVPIHILKPVLSGTEKLFLMLSCVLRGEYGIRKAQGFMKKTGRTLVCHSHFFETLDVIYSMLNVSKPMNARGLDNMMVAVNTLRPNLTEKVVVKMFGEFSEAHCGLKESAEFQKPRPPPLDHEDPIIPKNNNNETTVSDNQRCQICNDSTRHESLKIVTIDDEKVLLMLGCLYRKEFNLCTAREFLSRKTKTYVCHVHFEETLDDIYSMLGLSSPDEVQCCSDSDLYDTMFTVIQLRSQISEEQQLRKILFDFAVRYEHLRENRRNLSATYKPLPPPISQNQANDDDIIPKNVLGEDDTDGGTMEEAKPSDNEECDNPGSRQGMHLIPRSEDRLCIEKLGSGFERRLKRGEEDNLICKSHFPEEAFSSRGSLILEAESGRDRFKKVDEQMIGMYKNPRVSAPMKPEPVKDAQSWLTEEQCYEMYHNLGHAPFNNHRCQICGQLVPDNKSKHVTVDNEKLLLMLANVYQEKLDVHTARVVLNRRWKFHVCHVHFLETLNAIYSMLKVSTPDEIQRCSDGKMLKTLEIVVQLRSHITGQQMRKILYDFAVRHHGSRSSAPFQIPLANDMSDETELFVDFEDDPMLQNFYISEPVFGGLEEVKEEEVDYDYYSNRSGVKRRGGFEDSEDSTIARKFRRQEDSNDRSQFFKHQYHHHYEQ